MNAPAPSPPSVSPFGPAPLGERLLLGLVLLIGASVRLARINATEAWLDEACISLFAQAPFPDGWAWVTAQESHPPLYYLLMTLWTRLFGAGEIALRMPSVVASMASTGLVWMLARQLGARASLALAGALIYAVSPPAIYYAVEARSYAILQAFSLLAVVALHRAVLTGGPRASLTAGLATVAAALTHYFGLLVLAPWAIAILAARPPIRRAVLRAGLTTALVLLVAVAPSLLSDSERTATSWITDYWTGPLDAWRGSFDVFAMAPPYPRYLGQLGAVSWDPWVGWMARGLLGVPPLAAMILLWRRHAAWIVITAALTPPLALALVSLVRPVYLVGRYELQALAPWLALWPVGVELVIRRIDGPGRAWGAALVGLIAAFVASGPYVFAEPGPRPWSAAADWLARRPTSESIIAMGLTRAPLEHQLRARGSTRPVDSFPADIEDHIGWWHPDEYSTDELFEYGTSLATSRSGTVWLVIPLVDNAPKWPRGTSVVMEAFRRAGWNRDAPQSLPGFGIVRLHRRAEDSSNSK